MQTPLQKSEQELLLAIQHFSAAKEDNYLEAIEHAIYAVEALLPLFLSNEELLDNPYHHMAQLSLIQQEPLLQQQLRNLALYVKEYLDPQEGLLRCNHQEALLILWLCNDLVRQLFYLIKTDLNGI